MKNQKQAGQPQSLALLPNYELINFRKWNCCNQSSCFEIRSLQKMSLATRCILFSDTGSLELCPGFLLKLCLFFLLACLPYGFALLIFHHLNLFHFLIHYLFFICQFLIRFHFSFLNLIKFHFLFYFIHYLLILQYLTFNFYFIINFLSFLHLADNQNFHF